MLYILFFISREDKDVVKVDYIEYVNISIKSIVNIGLKGSRGISQTERYNEVFIVAISRPKGGLLLVSFSYPYLVVGVS